MDLSAILNDVQDEEGLPAEREAETARVTETHHGLPRLLRLPAVLHDTIICHLSQRDIKNLRLTCTFFHGIARLRLHRVFISAHQRDIQVLHAIADSDTFRSGVTELIWDDARFSKFPHLARAIGRNDEEISEAADDDSAREVPQWFINARNENIHELNSRKGSNADRTEHTALAEQLSARLPVVACWEHYQELLRQQDAVLESGADEAAFRYALQRFPSLKRVTITPAAHGWLFNPLYETPTIRALPYGFNYPIPRGWPTAQDGCPPHEMRPWAGKGADWVGKEQWRGVRIALRVLADPQAHHGVTELVLDAHHLNTGLNCRIFQFPAESTTEYKSLCALLRRPGFARLDLALTMGGEDSMALGVPDDALSWPELHDALARAPGMRHYTLRTNCGSGLDARALVRDSGGRVSTYVPIVPLGAVVPTAFWTQLRHFGLSGFLVYQKSVLKLLGKLPGSLRSVELSFLHFVDGYGDWRGVLRDMRDTLDWRARQVGRRPDVVVGHALVVPQCGRAVWADREAMGNFLYGDGPNPFGADGDPNPNQIVKGNGVGIVRDAFDPSHERPW